MPIPIVIAAFGTTSHAHKTYSFMNQHFEKRFAGHEIHWAFSSRMVKDHIKKHSQIQIKNPCEVLTELYAQGHSWVVVQSLHLINGHEFYRLVDEVKSLPVRTSIGLPLLSSYHDYCKTAKAMGISHCQNQNCSSTSSNFKERILSADEAVVIVGHGTDHPAWSSYLAFESVLKKMYGQNIFVGLIEGEPDQSQIIGDVVKSGAKKVHLVPFTLVAGVHFQEDIANSEDSWKSAFEQAGVTVEVEAIGIGYKKGVVDIFMDHIQDALSAIPDSK